MLHLVEQIQLVITLSRVRLCGDQRMNKRWIDICQISLVGLQHIIFCAEPGSFPIAKSTLFFHV